MMPIEPPLSPPGVAGIILAGGRSSRMGKNKGLLPVPGRAALTLLEHLALLLSDLCQEVLLVTRDAASGDEYFALPSLTKCRLVYDQVPDQGPLMGLASGLQACTLSHALVLAVDMPFVEMALLSWLAAFPLTDEMLVPRVQGTPQVLLARYPRALLPTIEAALAAGRRDLRALLRVTPVHFLEEPLLRVVDPELRSFVNVNTPEEFAHAHYS
jgi:molybdopterin-guanine dinucleotide biosynthesis protein A